MISSESGLAGSLTLCALACCLPLVGCANEDQSLSAGLQRELKEKSTTTGLALVGVRGSRVQLIPFGSNAITATSTHGFDPAYFSSDGSKVIWVTDDGLSVETVTGVWLGGLKGSFVNVRNVSLSPDGTQVIFDTTNRTSSRRAAGLYYGQFDSNAVDLLVPPGAPSDGWYTYSGGLGWSSDSKQIIYDRDGSIFTMDVRTKRAATLCPGTMPAWSPDGKSIVYVAPDGSARIMNSDGTDSRPILKDRQIVGSLHWSPDSQYLMFAEQYRPGFIESWERPYGSSVRLVVMRVSDNASLPVFWFGAKGGTGAYFSWMYNYQQFRTATRSGQ